MVLCFSNFCNCSEGALECKEEKEEQRRPQRADFFALCQVDFAVSNRLMG